MNFVQLVNKLIELGVEFVEGLNEEEINGIEKLYNIHFPADYKEFLMFTDY
jgi:hypothetical protein